MDNNTPLKEEEKVTIQEDVKKRFYERLTELIEQKPISRQNFPGTKTSSIERLRIAIARTKAAEKSSKGSSPADIKIEDSTQLSSRMMDYPI